MIDGLIMNWYKKAQADDYFGEDEDLLQVVLDEVWTPFSQSKTKACKTVYEIKGVKVLLWIITGGEPALAFEDYSFTEHFPPVASRGDDSWSNEDHKYNHQDSNDMPGPTVAVLPNGAETLRDFVRRNLPIKQLRHSRFSMLPFSGRITSRKKKNKETKSFSNYNLDLIENRVGIYGINEDNYQLFPWGYAMIQFLEPFLGSTTYDVFTNAQFETFVELLIEGKASGELKI